MIPAQDWGEHSAWEQFFQNAGVRGTIAIVDGRTGQHLVYNKERGKTGWAFDLEPQIGWFVGWVETPDGPVFFALNIDMTGGLDDAPKREQIARRVLFHLCMRLYTLYNK